MNEIRRKRRELGWSQFKLWQESGVSRNKIALHEQGYISLRGEELEKVHKALNIVERKGGGK